MLCDLTVQWLQNFPAVQEDGVVGTTHDEVVVLRSLYSWRRFVVARLVKRMT